MRSASMGVALFGEGAEEVVDLRGKLAGGGELVREVGEFVVTGKVAEPQQVGSFLEGGLIGELVDIDAAVGQHTGIAVDPANAGVGCHYPFETFGHCRRCHLLPFLRPA